MVIDRIADTVDGRHGGDNDGVASLQQRLGCRQAHLLDMLVDVRVFLDEQIFRRYVGLGLVIVVIRDEILDGVFRKEFAHFRVKLGGECFVGRHDQRRDAEARNDMRHGVGLARSGDAQQCLVDQPVAHPCRQLVNGLGLIAGRRKRLMQPVRAVGEGDNFHENRAKTPMLPVSLPSGDAPCSGAMTERLVALQKRG